MKILIFENEKKTKDFEVKLKNKGASNPIHETPEDKIKKRLIWKISKSISKRLLETLN